MRAQALSVSLSPRGSSPFAGGPRCVLTM
jgi:hypothetical protein